MSVVFKSCLIVKTVSVDTVEPRHNGFEESNYSYPLLLKSVIANIEIKRHEYQGTRIKSAIVRFSTTIGSVFAGYYCTVNDAVEAF